jgi:hypothetical protein
MNTITTRGPVSRWRRIAEYFKVRLLQWEIDGYDRDLDVLHDEAANNREARRLIQAEQMRRKARLNDLKR